MNVQQVIIKGIKELLFFNNYLVIPNFGGFVLKNSPSHFYKAGSILAPPSKTLSFNSQLKQNDGILVFWLQQQLKIDADNALQDLNEFSDYCKSILTTRHRLTIDGIGFFYLDFENNVCFEPQLDTNFLVESFGLKPITIVEIPETLIGIKDKIDFDNRIGNEKINNIKKTKKKKKYTGLVVSLALFVSLFSLLAIIVTNSKFNGKLKSALFESDHVMTYSPLNYAELTLFNVKKENTGYVSDANGVANVEIENNKIISVKVVEHIENIKTVKKTVKVNKHIKQKENHFEIVLGCFGVLDNAKRLKQKLKSKNIEAFILEQNAKGMYVVSNGGFETIELAIKQLEQINSVCPNAWIKKPE